MAGADRDGGPFGMLLMDAMAGGGGAYIDHDGLATPNVGWATSAVLLSFIDESGKNRLPIY
jgi:hypothetical protein